MRPPMRFGSRVWMRRSGHTRSQAGVTFVMTLFFGLFAVGLLGQPNTFELLAVKVMFAGAAIASAALTRGCVRAGLWIAPDGIVVRGPMRTWRLALVDVDRFDHAVVGPGLVHGFVTESTKQRTREVWVHRKDGPPIIVWALRHDGPIWVWERRAREREEQIVALNAVLKSLRGEAGADRALAQPSLA